MRRHFLPILAAIAACIALPLIAPGQSKTYTNNEDHTATVDTTGDVTLTVDNADAATQSGVISGPGSVTKSGTGNLTLSANNTYSGGTTISAGLLTIGAGGAAGSVPGNVTNHGTLVFDRSDDYTYLGVISGSGGLILDGYILRFDQAQTYAGPTVVKSGGYLVLSTHFDQGLAATTTVDLEAGSNFDLSNRALTIAGLTGAGTLYSFNASAGHLTLDLAADTTMTFAGILGGASFPNFALTKTGAGTQVLSGANTYTGLTTVSAGELVIASSSALGSTAAGTSIADGATLVLSGAGSYSTSEALSGDGAVRKTDSGSWILSGDNSYTGDTTIAAGALTFGSTAAFYGGTIDSTTAARVTVADGAVLGLGIGHANGFTGADYATLSAHANLGSTAIVGLDTTFATGGIATWNDTDFGSAALNKIGTGTLALTGSTTLAQDTTVFAGTLTFGNTGAYYGGTLDATTAGRLTVRSGATAAFAVGSAGTFATSDLTGIVAAHATFESGSFLGLDTSNATGGTFTWSDPALGTLGLHKLGTGTLILPGNNTYTGSTAISGGTLQIGDGGTTGSLASATIINAANLTFNRSDAHTYAGAISGSGTLTQAGSGTLVLSGANTYTGATTISAGTLQIGDGGAAAFASSGVANSGHLVFHHSNTLAYAGALSGTGTVAKTGTGTLTFTGTDTGTGDLTISGGTFDWAVTGFSINRDVTVSGADAVLAFSAGTSRRFGDSADGSLTISNGGTVTQASASSLSYIVFGDDSGVSGTGTITGAGSSLTSNSVLRVGFSGQGSLDLANGGTATFLHGSGTSAIGFSATGVGVTSVTGSGSALSFTAHLIVGNSGSGVLNIGDGGTVTANRLQLAANSGSTGTLNLNAGGTLVVSDATATALSSGAGTATFNFAGGTLKSNGTHALTVTSNATLAADTTSTFDTNGQAGTFSGIVSGAGSLNKTGSGTLTLSAANTYTGATLISAGTLALDASGSLAQSSSISVASGAVFDPSSVGNFTLASDQTLTGSGSIIGALTVSSGAHLAPGNSPGTLTFSSGLTLASGSILDFELGTASDLLAVTGGVLTGPAGTGGITLNLSDAGGFAAATYLLFDFSGATLSGFEATDFTLGQTIAGYDYSFNLTGSTLELVATSSAIPEPSTYAALFGLAALGWAWRRRRHAAKPSAPTPAHAA